LSKKIAGSPKEFGSGICRKIPKIGMLFGPDWINNTYRKEEGMIKLPFHRHKAFWGVIILIIFSLVLGLSNPAIAAECKNRGDLDAQFCDDNKDFLADTIHSSSPILQSRTLLFMKMFSKS
jgi:hypothetical protein